jgi:hypothetical protein
MKKIIRNNVIGFVLAGLLCGAVTVISASQNLSSSSVEYKDSKSVSTALNELYAKESQLPRKYKIGDKVKVKNEDYYVIADSPRDQDYVTLLKAEPLTVEEVNTYGGVGTENNHVNKNTYSSVGTAYNSNGYGGLAYYSSPTCGYTYVDGVRQSEVTSGCVNSYNTSDIKFVLDVWEADKFTSEDLKEIDGYKVRLVKREELISQFYPKCSGSTSICSREATTPSWLYNSEYSYWTMTYRNYFSWPQVWDVQGSGMLGGEYMDSSRDTIRPVINIYKNKI